VVVLDEFQEIMRIGGRIWKGGLRAAIQHHSKVSYLFAGSKSHMLIDMVSEKTRPFYQMGTLMTLDKIPEDEFKYFVRSKFAKRAKKISREAIDRIFTESQNIPPLCAASFFSYLGSLPGCPGDWRGSCC